MDENPQETAKSLAKALENVTGVFGKIAGPFADEFGLIVGDRMRFYRLSRAIALLEKTKLMFEAARFDPCQVPPSLFLPIIDNASVQDNEALHDKWAALLANAAAPGNNILPAFSETLKQLSASEAQFLDRAFDQVADDQKAVAYPVSIREETLASIPRVMLENVYRLRLVTRDTLEVDPKQPFRMRAGRLPFQFSDFGRAFVLACRPPQAKSTIERP